MRTPTRSGNFSAIYAEFPAPYASATAGGVRPLVVDDRGWLRAHDSLADGERVEPIISSCLRMSGRNTHRVLRHYLLLVEPQLT
jgi:hypothetical protein